MRDEEWFDLLDAAFALAMAPWRERRSPICLLFSGGVDSGAIAWELRRHPALTLYTMGVAGSPDLRAAEDGAALLGLRWVRRQVNATDVRDLGDRVRGSLHDLGRTARSVQTAFALALERAPPGVLLCGQGADELFLGYAHFGGLDSPAAERRSNDDLDRLLDRDWPRSQSIAERLGREVAAPYLDPGFVRSARSIPIELRLPRPTPKDFFRRWALRRGVPAPIALRPKRALQYGSGVDRLLAADLLRAGQGP